MAASPFGLAEPLSVAVRLVTELAALVVTVGAVSVTKVTTPPNAVPAAFEAIAQ